MVKVTLSLQGLLKAASTEEPSAPKQKFDWSNALVDSGIMAGLTFLTSLGGMSAIGIPSPNILMGATIAGGTQFFLILALKRKLVKES